MSSNIASYNRAVLGSPSGITHILLPPLVRVGEEGGQAAMGEGLGIAADKAENNNNTDNDNLLIIVKIAIIVFSGFINFGKSGLLTLLAY